MKLFVFLFIFLIFISHSCEENKTRYPLNKKKDVFLKTSAYRNKALYTSEEFLIKKAAKLDSLNKYHISDAGYLYAKIRSTNKNFPLPEKGERVQFKYQIEDLDRNIIYSYKELGIVDYLIDQENLLPALREGIRIMRPMEIAVFLFPSYLCYSYQGDGIKIDANQPLRFTIERTPLKN